MRADEAAGPASGGEVTTTARLIREADLELREGLQSTVGYFKDKLGLA